jgi:sulfur oxidation c-type cytochrome SoxX
MRTALAIAAFVVLIVHGIVFYDQFFHPWERQQYAYFDQARTLAKTDAERAALDARQPRIEQVIVTQFGDTHVDRCLTCHIASDDPRFKEHFQPLKTHPYSEALGDRLVNGRWERRHKFSDFGCTVCHDGQGRGLKTFYSHGQDPFWPEPMIGYVTQSEWRSDFASKLKGKEYMQAKCALCHTEENFQGTAQVDKGRKLFFSQNCYGCHRIDGLSEGTLGPDLTEVGKKWKLDYLWESIVEPRANIATSFMPKFNLSEDDTKALVIFLKSRRGMNFAETSMERYRARLNERVPAKEEPVGAEDAKVLAAEGEKSLRSRACTACHKMGTADGGIAPDLSFEGLIKNEEWLQDHFKDPRSRIPDSIMPAFRFQAREFRALSAYLTGLNTPPAFPTPEATYAGLCARCHGDKGDGSGTIAWYLDPAPRDLTRAAFINSKPADRFYQSIREGVPGTSMPAWGKVLNDEQVRGVFAHVEKTCVNEPRKELKARSVPEKNPVAAGAESAGRGETTFVQRCSGCHGRKADGKGPNSVDIVPRPRNLRNSAFVNSLNDRRLFESILYGVQGTAMPPWIDYGLSQNEVGDLVNFIRSMNIK